MEVSGQLHAPASLPPRERAPGTHWIGGWVGPKAVMDAVMKGKIPSSRWESNSVTPIVQPVAQRYTDWAITALRIDEPLQMLEPSFQIDFNQILQGVALWHHYLH
jgi:hypothetical protein